jgi:hypothetical protein
MAEAPKFAPDPRTEIETFRDAARELTADDDEARRDERLKRLAKAEKAPPPRGLLNSDEK